MEETPSCQSNYKVGLFYPTGRKTKTEILNEIAAPVGYATAAEKNADKYCLLVHYFAKRNKRRVYKT
jgi:hypothetical protein